MTTPTHTVNLDPKAREQVQRALDCFDTNPLPAKRALQLVLSLDDQPNDESWLSDAATELRSVSTRTVDEGIAMLIGMMKERSDAHFAKQYPNLTPDAFSVSKGGRKYARIIKTTDGGIGQNSVAAFVDKTTGDIWYAATWKSPALNFTRGNVRDDTIFSWLDFRGSIKTK